MNPIQMLLQRMMAEQAQQQRVTPIDWQNPVPSAFAPSTGQQGSMPMRPPMQEGPVPPTSSPLAAMFQRGGR